MRQTVLSDADNGTALALRDVSPYRGSVIALFLKAGKGKTLLAALGMIAAIVVADAAIGNRASLGVLYIVPMVVAAGVLGPIQIGALALLCSVLRSSFDIPAPPLEVFLRFLFAFLAYTGSGLIVVVRNRAAEIEHYANIRREQELRREAEKQLEILVESSPAAIVTVDGTGTVLAANKAGNELLMLPDAETLKGRPIGPYLPVLADALQFDPGPAGLRTAAQCQGFRENGEVFLANLWFSSWNGPEGQRLAAIIVDSSEEMRDREEENLQQLLRANQIAAAALSHEVRNLCGAISVVAANLRDNPTIGPNEDVQALRSLVTGLEKIASVELNTGDVETLGPVSLKSVLDDLRIVIEPQWREIGGSVRWWTPPLLPDVLAERYGLLQVFLNLARNSHRAVQECEARKLSITTTVEQHQIRVRFEDTGPGVQAPERLFAPFQPGSDGTGLGLYVSRSVVRSYGGDLRWEPWEQGSRFVVEVQRVMEGGDE
ncbi:MAG TPA: PAS domain-containing sensor histidine kinase [Bryobacteraceae bacterium]|nr:PAS domain-containing sensor histidine kinase [Bryobacteraceae bacterium]